MKHIIDLAVQDRRSNSTYHKTEMSSIRCWATALKQAGASEGVITSWQALRSAVASHQKILSENGIGKEVSERDRIRVNARRVGLQAPMFADEAAAAIGEQQGGEGTFSDILKAALNTRHANQHEQEQQSMSTSSSSVPLPLTQEQRRSAQA